jgi:hypothetical protein
VALSGLVLGAVGVVVSTITAHPFLASDTLWVAVITVAPWVAGRLVRRDRDRAELLEQMNVRLEKQQEQRAASASADERLRIAREQHDVIAHALSVVVVQARGGRRMLNRDRKAEAAEGFDAVELAAQQALGEMRRLLGVLRSSDHAPAFAPTPGLARLPELIARIEDTGLSVIVEVDGDAPGSPSPTNQTPSRSTSPTMVAATATAPTHPATASPHTRARLDLRRRPQPHQPSRRRLLHDRPTAIGNIRMIRVLIADDEQLVRGGLRPSLRTRATSPSSPRPPTALKPSSACANTNPTSCSWTCACPT